MIITVYVVIRRCCSRFRLHQAHLYDAVCRQVRMIRLIRFATEVLSGIPSIVTDSSDMRFLSFVQLKLSSLQE